jgi:large subunit ribosomal protein L10
MPSQEKYEAVAEIKDRLGSASAFVIADYRGLNVKEMQELRRNMTEAGCYITIYKNRLTKIALAELEIDSMDENLEGPTAFALSDDDPVLVAKTLVDFAKEHEALEVKGGFIDEAVVDAAMIKTLAALPSREELIAKLMGSLQGPTAGLVRVLDGPVSAFARTLRAIADQKAAEVA